MDHIQNLMLEQLARTAPEGSLSILEVGCGKNALLPYVATLSPHATLTGIDVSQKAIDTARRISRTPVKWQVASVEHTPFEDDQFDIVLACRTLHHWKDKAQGLAEISRILKPQGFLLLGDPFTEGLLAHSWLNWIAEKLDGGTVTSLGDLQCMLALTRLQLTDKIVVPSSAGMLLVCMITKLSS